MPWDTDTTDKTPGEMTWDELLTHMDDVSSNGHAATKYWKAVAGRRLLERALMADENRKEKEEYDIASCVQYAENNQWTVGWGGGEKLHARHLLLPDVRRWILGQENSS